MKCYKYILYIGLFILIIGLCAYIFFPLKDHWQHHYTRSEIALKNDQYQNAVESCNKAIELEPDHPNIYEVYVNKAKALNKLHSYKEAIETANQAIALNPHSEEAYETKVYPLFQLRREEELTAVLEEIIVINPHNPLRGFLNYLRADRGKVNY